MKMKTKTFFSLIIFTLWINLLFPGEESVFGQDVQQIQPLEDDQLRQKVQEAEQQLSDAEQELEQLEKQKARMEQQANRNRAEERQLQNRIERLERSVRVYKRKLEIFNYNLDKDFPRRKSKLEAMQTDIQTRLNQLDRMVNALVRGSLAWPVDRGTGNSRRSHLCKAALQRLLPSILAEKKQLLEEKQQVEVQLEELEKDIRLDHILIERAQKGLEAAGEDHSEVRDQLQTASAAREKAVEEARRLESRIRALNALVAQLREEKLPQLYEGVDYVPFSEQKGQLLWPVSGQVVHQFGPRKHSNPEFNLTLKSTGLDLDATAGQQVRAAASGQVAYVGHLPGFGPSVMLHHGGDFMTFYTPVDSAGLAENQPVEKGQVIGSVFQNEPGSKSLFHFEIRQGDKAVNPEQWLRQRPE
jgi:murein hydrolase activator